MTQSHDLIHAQAEDAAFASEFEGAQHERVGAPLDAACSVYAVVRWEGHGDV